MADVRGFLKHGRQGTAYRPVEQRVQDWKLVQDDFYHPAHRLIFDAIQRLRDQGHAPDALAVREELQRHGDLEGAGGSEYLARIVDIVPTAANIAYHVKIVLENSVKRKLITVATRVVGDPESPLFDGYSCPKGRALPELHAHAGRLLTSLARGADGALAPIDVERAMDEIAEKVTRLVAEHGPRSIALYVGTNSLPYPVAPLAAHSWLAGLGSKMFFTSNTIGVIIDSAFVFIFLFVIFLIAGWLVVIPAVAFVLAIVVGLVAQARIGKSMATAAERWTLFVGAARAIGERIGSERFVEIRYEDLLSAPEATITEVLRLIGEPFDPAVLSFHERRRPVGTDPVNDRNIQKPLQAANSGKWEAEVGRHEIEVFEAIAGATLDACGYQRATSATPMTATERTVERYLRHPPRKVAAMLRNRAGIAEGLERTRIKWRLRMDGLAGGGGREPGASTPGAAEQG